MKRLFLTLWFVTFSSLCLAEEPAPTEKSDDEEQREPISDEPLPVRHLLSDQGEWFFSIGFGYANGNTLGLNLNNNEPLFDYSVLSLTSQNNQTNSDALSVSPSIRYGFTDDTNLSMSFNLSAFQTRTQSGSDITSTSDSRFSSISLSLSHSFKREGDTPALIGSIGTSLVENVGLTSDKYESGKVWNFNLSSYRVFDPIVLSGSVGYLLALERETDINKIDPGDAIFVNASVSFIPNPNSSLSAGFSWVARDKDKINGVKQGITRTATSLNLGVGYEWSKQTSVFAGVGMIASGGDGATITLSISHDFKEK